MLHRTLTVLAMLACLAAGPACAENIMQATETWEGKPFAYPPGTPQVTAFMLRLEEGQAVPFHCHPVPTMGYVLKGTIEVETPDGRKKIMREGEPAVEVFRTVHRGRAVGGPVEIIVFYAGSTDMPTTVLPQNDPESKYCDPVAS